MKKVARLATSLNLNLFANAPETFINLAYPSASQAVVTLTLNSQVSVDEVIAEIYNYDGLLEATLNLLDDGNNADGAANDNIWGIKWLTDQRTFGMYANVLIISGTDTARWEHLLDNITTLGPVVWDDLIIVSDNINEDGIINSGEKIVFSPSINNGSNISIGKAKVGTIQFGEYIISQNATETTEVEALPPGITNLEDNFNRYFVLADDTPDGHLLNLRFAIVDRQHNLWVSKLQVPVKKLSFGTEFISADHTLGTAQGVVVGYRIADPSALTNETYEVTFNEVESVFTFNLENLSTFTFLLQSEPMPEDNFSSTVPVTEGFKVVFDNISFEPPVTWFDDEFSFDADPSDGDLDLWGDSQLFGSPTGFYNEFGSGTPVPTAAAAQVDLQFRFTGVAPDNDSPVTSGGSFSTQWERGAFGEPDLTGFNRVQLRIPFELWDLEGNDGAGRQIEVAVINRNADGASPYENDVGTAADARWRITGRDYIVVLNKDYTDDATLERSLTDPAATWLLFFRQLGASVWSTGDEYTIKYANPLQAGVDVYRFQVPIIGVDEDNGLPRSFELAQNYPNPFNPETTIQYYLPVKSDVKLLIYNLLGQEVFKYELRGQDAGKHQLIWNGKNKRGDELSSGLYIYKFLAGDFSQTKKMLLLK